MRSSEYVENYQHQNFLYSTGILQERAASGLWMIWFKEICKWPDKFEDMYVVLGDKLEQKNFLVSLEDLNLKIQMDRLCILSKESLR